jgi:hypothetical protein
MLSGGVRVANIPYHLLSGTFIRQQFPPLDVTLVSLPSFFCIESLSIKLQVSWTQLGPKCSFWFGFQARSQNCWKGLLASSCLTVCLSVLRQSVRPHGTSWLPVNGFLWNLIFEYFSKICREVQVSLKSDKNNGYSTWRLMHVYDILLTSFKNEKWCWQML